MKKVLKYTRTVFSIYMALHFLCNASLLHNHIIDGENISHAHPFSAIQHNADEAELISLINITPAVAADVVFAPEITVIAWNVIFTPPMVTVPVSFADIESLRGPPTLQF